MHTLHEVQDAAIAARDGNRTALAAMILPVDAAVPDLPIVLVRDSAIDALCHGAVLAGVGVVSGMEFGKDQTVAVLSQKKEFICLGRALVPSGSFSPGGPGWLSHRLRSSCRPAPTPMAGRSPKKSFPKRENERESRTGCAEKTQEILGDTTAIDREEGRGAGLHGQADGRQGKEADRQFRKRDTIKKIPGIQIGYTFC